MKILYVHATVVPPPTDLQTDRFYLLSEKLEGDEAVFGPGSYPVYTAAGRFRYHWYLAYRHRGLRQKFATWWFYLSKGRELFKQRQYACMDSHE